MLALAEPTPFLEYGLSGRAAYVRGDAGELPFADETFDAVFSAGSLHEWAEPRRVFGEIERVLRPDGTVVIADFRRDMRAPLRWFLWLNARPHHAARPRQLAGGRLHWPESSGNSSRE